MEQVELTLYYPNVGTFQVLVPEGYHIADEDDGIISITEPDGLASITISTYTASAELSEGNVCEFFERFTENFTPLSPIETKHGNNICLQQKFTKGDLYWTFWAVASGTQIAIISVNSKTELEPEPMGLYSFIIDRFEFRNPDTEINH